MEGTALRGLIDRGRRSEQWPLAEALSAALVRPVLLALAEAHAKTPPEVHRGVCADSVSVSSAGTVRLERSDRARASGADMSPEQAHGRALDERSDVYGAAALLFELACGKPVVDSVSALALGELHSARTANPHLSDGLAAVLDRALKLEPHERFASVKELLAALDAAVSPAGETDIARWVSALPAPQPSAARRPQVAPVPQPPVAAAPVRKRNPRHLLLTAAGVAAVLGLTLFGLQVAESRQDEKQNEYQAALRRCDVVTDPPGAQILLDGRPYPEHAPAVLKLERGRDYTLEVRGSTGSAALHIKDQKRVLIHLQGVLAADTMIENESWDAPPPKGHAKPAADDQTPLPAVAPPVPGAAAPAAADENRPLAAAAATAAPAPVPTAPAEDAKPGADAQPEHIALDAEAAPVTFKLTRAHEVVVPAATCRDLRIGTVTLYQRPQVVSTMAPVHAPSTEDLYHGRRFAVLSDGAGLHQPTVLYLSGHGAASPMSVGVFRPTLSFESATRLCTFELTDRSLDQLVVDPQLRIGSSSVEVVKQSLVTVPLERRFLVRSLPTRKRWVVASTAKLPYPVMTIHTARSDRAEVLDQPLELPTNAESVWFTVPVLEPVDIDYAVSVTEQH